MKQAQIIPLLKFQSGRLPVKVQSIKDFAEEQDEINEGPHSHDYHEMIWLIKGQGTLYIDMQEYTIGPNTLFYIKPNVAHQFQERPDMEGFVFSFTDDFLGMGERDLDTISQVSLCKLFAERRTINIESETGKDVEEIVLKMIKELENEYAHKRELLKRYFKIILIYLARTTEEVFQSTEQSRETELVNNFMRLLNKDYKEKKMVAEYAAQLLVTSNYLNRIVKKITGFSAGLQIRQRVVLEAKRMARYSDAGMKEIAYNLGFLDSAHFSRFFKTFGGLNFSDFKRGAQIIPMNTVFNRA
ncbi:helix-turn-helix transcriptional regulator [Danxiaibacter flavus]|uniref:Helix-turn-helix transcriptional regulator n=1 Tax=Danxiaibacter flavus TaxID=3049108 RepID=A0ABV3ZJ27_9BACT|nr:helix-turn-helix transcriptional regulator [Chitinophagaceae bacterium DXS]